MESVSWGDSFFKRGKHAGKKYKTVIELDKKYCSYILSTGFFPDFTNYIKSLPFLRQEDEFNKKVQKEYENDIKIRIFNKNKNKITNIYKITSYVLNDVNKEEIILDKLFICGKCGVSEIVDNNIGDFFCGWCGENAFGVA